MDNYTATEIAYKNGYEQGKKDAVKWISVKEKLPPFHKQVLVISGGKVYVAEELLTWEDGHATIYIRDFGKWRKFTHWMPLPEPPKEV